MLEYLQEYMIEIYTWFSMKAENLILPKIMSVFTFILLINEVSYFSYKTNSMIADLQEYITYLSTGFTTNIKNGKLRNYVRIFVCFVFLSYDGS